MSYYLFEGVNSLDNDEVVTENTVISCPFVFRPKEYDRENDNTKSATIFVRLSLHFTFLSRILQIPDR